MSSCADSSWSTRNFCRCRCDLNHRFWPKPRQFVVLGAPAEADARCRCCASAQGRCAPSAGRFVPHSSPDLLACHAGGLGGADPGRESTELPESCRKVASLRILDPPPRRTWRDPKMLRRCSRASVQLRATLGPILAKHRPKMRAQPYPALDLSFPMVANLLFRLANFGEHPANWQNLCRIGTDVADFRPKVARTLGSWAESRPLEQLLSSFWATSDFARFAGGELQKGEAAGLQHSDTFSLSLSASAGLSRADGITLGVARGLACDSRSVDGGVHGQPGGRSAGAWPGEGRSGLATIFRFSVADLRPGHRLRSQRRRLKHGMSKSEP